MKKAKNIRKVGALALTFAIIMTFIGVVPISAKQEYSELPKAPYVDGEHYYPLEWYLNEGIVTDKTTVCLASIAETYVTQNELQENTYEDDEGNEINELGWSGIGDLYIPSSFSVTCEYSEICNVLKDHTSSEIYLDMGGIYFKGITIRIVTETTDDNGIGGLVGSIFDGFGTAVDGISDGVKTMFNSLLWNDGTASSGLSHFAKFGFVMAGLSLTLGLGYVIIRKIRG